MQTFHFQKTSELRKAKKELEKKLDIEIEIKGKKIAISGSSLNEYSASLVLDAMNFGFSAKKSLSIAEEEKIFRIISIKNFTRKKNLKAVRARIIGKQGKTKKTIENIANCHLIIKDNEVGIIANPESIEELVTAIINLVKGTKQSNTYRYLEKMNKRKN